jgi:hypothetical protein
MTLEVRRSGPPGAVKQPQRIADQAQLILDHRLIVDHQSRCPERGEFARYP